MLCRSFCCEQSTAYTHLLHQPPPLYPRLRPWTLSLTKVTEQVSPSGLSTPNALSLVLLWTEHGLHAPAPSAPSPHPPATPLDSFTYQSNRTGVSIRAIYSQRFAARFVLNRARPTRTCFIRVHVHPKLSWKKTVQRHYSTRALFFLSFFPTCIHSSGVTPWLRVNGKPTGTLA